MVYRGLLQAGWTALKRRVDPPVPTAIREALTRAQFESVRRQVPMLLSVAAINTVIVMAVCAHDGLPLSNYGWMALLILYCVVRMVIWAKRLRKPVLHKDVPHLLNMNVGVSLLLTSVLGMAVAYTFVARFFPSELLIPMSLGFGATAIAHCFYTLRPAAIGTLVMGLFPSSLAMLVVGGFDAKMLGLSMMSVGVLMIRFVAEQYDQLIASLLLQHENRQMALTDPLTGIANRRAMMDELDAEAMAGQDYGVALLDLDGFKQVNDSLGHYAGDAMLQSVGQRLVAAALPSDSVGRLGGDEFMIIFRGIGDENDLSARTTAMMAALCRPTEIDGHVVPIVASLGYGLSRGEEISPTVLLRRADKALYSAKRQRRTVANAPARPARQSRLAGIA